MNAEQAIYGTNSLIRMVTPFNITLPFHYNVAIATNTASTNDAPHLAPAPRPI